MRIFRSRTGNADPVEVRVESLGSRVWGLGVMVPGLGVWNLAIKPKPKNTNPHCPHSANSKPQGSKVLLWGILSF